MNGVRKISCGLCSVFCQRKYILSRKYAIFIKFFKVLIFNIFRKRNYWGAIITFHNLMLNNIKYTI